MGIYAIEPTALSAHPARGAVRLPRPRAALLERRAAVGAFAHDGLWLDIGRHEDYENAVELWAHGDRLAEAEAEALVEQHE